MKSLIFVLGMIIGISQVEAQQPRQKQRGAASKGLPGRPGVEPVVTTLPVGRAGRTEVGGTQEINAKQAVMEILKGKPEASLAESPAKLNKLVKAYDQLKGIEGVEDYIRAVARALKKETPGASVLILSNIINTFKSFQDSNLLVSLKYEKPDILIAIIDDYTKRLADQAASGEATLRDATLKVLGGYLSGTDLSEAIAELEKKKALFSLRAKTTTGSGEQNGGRE